MAAARLREAAASCARLAVFPEPIAWVVTKGKDGVNAAPHSFFNVIGGSPADHCTGADGGR